MIQAAGLIASAAVSVLGKQGGAEGLAGGLGGGGMGGLDGLLKPLQGLLPGGGALPTPMELLQQAPTSAEELLKMQSPLDLLLGDTQAAPGQIDQ